MDRECYTFARFVFDKSLEFQYKRRSRSAARAPHPVSLRESTLLTVQTGEMVDTCSETWWTG